MIPEVIQYVHDQLQTNDFLTGFVGGGIITALLYVARNIPNKLWLLYTRNFAWEFQINDINALYRPSVLYFSDKLKHKMRRIKLEQDSDNNIEYTPAYGTHYMWMGTNFIVITMSEEKLENSKERKESIHLTIFGTSPKQTFYKMVETILKYQKEKTEKYYIYDYSYYWNKIKNIPKRSLDTIYLDSNIKEKIVNDIDYFYNNEQFYTKLGLPYKRGYIFYGAAGTGKSSIVVGLANYFQKNICYLDLNTLDSSSDVKSAFSSIPQNSILVLEDIDIHKSTHQRKDTVTPEKSDDAEEKVSLSTILQMMDGIYLTDGTIIIASTNYIDKLDRAFIRDGRFDLKLEFPLATREIAEQMIVSMNPDKMYLLDELQYPISQAELQNRLI